jgi:hypothetical protein
MKQQRNPILMRWVMLGCVPLNTIVEWGSATSQSPVDVVGWALAHPIDL